MSNRSAHWDEIRRLLREARKDLAPDGASPQTSPVPVGPLTGTLDEFEEFLDHDEFELAWDALASVAERVGAPPVCWMNLARAAGLLRLPDRESAAKQRVQTPK